MGRRTKMSGFQWLVGGKLERHQADLIHVDRFYIAYSDVVQSKLCKAQTTKTSLFFKPAASALLQGDFGSKDLLLPSN